MRFEYRAFSQCIYDNLTGWHYEGNEDTCKLLNDVNWRADKNAERIFKKRDEINQLRLEVAKRDDYLDELYKIMKKYGISDLNKLDISLREGRIV